MLKFRIYLIFAVVFLLGGCSTTNPFKQVKLMDVTDVNPTQIIENFAEQMPIELQIVNSVSFEYYWHSFYSLGYFKRNLTKNSFTLVALDPSGVRLFQITDTDGKIKYSYSIDKLKKLSSFVGFISTDIKNIYFKDVPSDKAIITKDQCKVIFTEPQFDGIIEYTFGGDNNYLLAKKFLKKRSWLWRVFLGDYYRIWSVEYYGYKSKNGKLYPENIYYENNDLNYQLVIRLKEIK